MKVAVCGGGSIALTAAAVLAARPGFEVSVLTREPSGWSDVATIHFGDRLRLAGPVAATDDPARAIGASDWVLLAVPAFAHAALLERIRPFLAPHAWVGCLGCATGFDWRVARALGSGARYFGLQRTPWVARTIVRGQVVHVTAVRSHVGIAGHPAHELAALAPRLSGAVGLELVPLNGYLSVTLGFDNPTLHPPRLFALYGSGRPVSPSVRFYGDWDDVASAHLLRLDDELARIRSVLNVPDEVGARAHFGANSPNVVTALIRSMAPLRHIAVPSRADASPDTDARFFQEDFAYGLAIHRELGRLAGVETPVLDTMLGWAERLIERSAHDRAAPPSPWQDAQSLGLLDAASVESFSRDAHLSKRCAPLHAGASATILDGSPC
ncbi:NAD/NADP octopine/nopaline dehydrogenase family protein [Burkholderia cepacia]|uniref:NAD/NADP octopine/nopaline dehydrogenase family protein n=1 Tax=Burkholderia cepacia TaxID=292 RepID=UPI00398E5ED7